MKSIKDLFGRSRLVPKGKLNERGELLEWLLMAILPSWDSKRFGKMTIGRLAWKVEGLNKQDLYYLKSICEDSKRRGENVGIRFFAALKVKE